jgi:hypothetical protein
MAAFRAKGRLDSLLSSVPVRVALDPRAPELGRGASRSTHGNDMSAAGPLLDTFSAVSLHCLVHPETYRSAVEPTRGAGHVEMPAETKARLRSLLLDELRRGRS